MGKNDLILTLGRERGLWRIMQKGKYRAMMIFFFEERTFKFMTLKETCQQKHTSK